MSRLARIAKLLLLAAVVLGVFFLSKGKRRAWRPSAPELVTPQLTLAVLRGPKTFFNGPARAAMEQAHAAFIPEPARDEKSEFSRGMTQAVQDARLFRELDRQVRFDELWLLGDPSSYKPLLEHLLETHDFVLVSIDHTSLVFRREGEAWSEAQLDALAARFADPRERAYVQALAAAKLIAVRQAPPALKLLQAAESAAKDVPEVWSGWSVYRMIQGEWDKALEAAEKALALDPDFLPGIACRAQCFYAQKHFFPAWKEAEKLLAAQPDDPAMLFYHAKLAHEARAFQAETTSLLRLIALAEQAKANVSGYRVYLAQSYAAQNDADNAMDQVTLALLDTTLPREQREFADELLGQIKRAMTGSSGR